VVDTLSMGSQEPTVAGQLEYFKDIDKNFIDI
jgi:hypothetical protein